MIPASFAFVMALFASGIATAASGSVGGLTFLPTRGGMAFRAKPAPTNPSTSRQSIVRRWLAFLASYWTETLSQAQRDTWELYAANVPRPGRLGRKIGLTGQLMWVRSNLPRRQAGLSLVLAAPGNFTVEHFTAIAPNTVDSIAQRLIFAFDNTDDWAILSGSAMLVYIAAPKNPSIRVVKRGYRFAGSVLGNTFVPPVSPANIPLPFRMDIGQQCHFRVTVTRLDGRYTGTQSATTSVT